jgi:hypothetical protein
VEERETHTNPRPSALQAFEFLAWREDFSIARESEESLVAAQPR